MAHTIPAQITFENPAIWMMNRLWDNCSDPEDFEERKLRFRTELICFTGNKILEVSGVPHDDPECPILWRAVILDCDIKTLDWNIVYATNGQKNIKYALMYPIIKHALDRDSKNRGQIRFNVLDGYENWDEWEEGMI